MKALAMPTFSAMNKQGVEVPSKDCYTQGFPEGSAPLYQLSGSYVTRTLKKGERPILIDPKPIHYRRRDDGKMIPYFHALIDGQPNVVALTSLKNIVSK
jgi:hypothetical protein